MPAIAVDQAFREIDSGYLSWFTTYGLALSASDCVDLIELKYPYSGVGYSGLPVIRGLWPNLDNLVRELDPDVIVGSGEFLLPLYGLVTGIQTVMITNLRYLRTEGGYFGGLRPVLDWLHKQTPLVLDYSIDGAQGLEDRTNTIWLGPLVRKFVIDHPDTVRSRLNLPEDKQIVLVTKGGGEDFPLDAVQGKGSRNQQEDLNFKLLETVFEVASMNKEQRNLLFVVITGLGNLYGKALTTIASLALENVRCVQFVPDIIDYIAASDLVIGRGGVSLIGEAARCRRAQILIPVHSDVEQLANANYLSEREAAISIPTDQVTSDLLNSVIKRLLIDLDERTEIANRARALFPQIDEAPLIAAKAIYSLNTKRNER
jgi:hypothetical protein